MRAAEHTVRVGDTTGLVAGAWCVIRNGQIIRAVRVPRGERQLVWVAGQGASGGGAMPMVRACWPVLYA